MTIDVKDAGNVTRTIETPNANGRAAAASSRPVALSTEDKTSLDAASAALAAMQSATGPVLIPSAATPLTGLITTAMTSTTSTAVTGMGTPGSGLFNYITGVVISNSHATQGTDVVLQDGNGGTVFATFPAGPVYGGVALALTTPIKQPTANTALYAKNNTSGASVTLTLIGYKGA